MRVIENILYYSGAILAFIGIWLMKDNLLLVIEIMPVALVLMFIGWVLDAYEVGYDNDL